MIMKMRGFIAVILAAGMVCGAAPSHPDPVHDLDGFRNTGGSITLNWELGSVPRRGTSASSAPTPGIRLMRLDGRVHSIELTCGCGEVSILEIEYDESENSTKATP